MSVRGGGTALPRCDFVAGSQSAGGELQVPHRGQTGRARDFGPARALPCSLAGQDGDERGRANGGRERTADISASTASVPPAAAALTAGRIHLEYGHERGPPEGRFSYRLGDQRGVDVHLAAVYQMRDCSQPLGGLRRTSEGAGWGGLKGPPRGGRARHRSTRLGNSRMRLSESETIE